MSKPTEAAHVNDTDRPIDLRSAGFQTSALPTADLSGVILGHLDDE